MREGSLLPQVLTVVGPVVTVLLGRPGLVVVVVVVFVEPGYCFVEPGYWLAWLICLLVAADGRAQ